MADDTRSASPKIDPVALEVNEDAETRATRHELKQSTISDPASAAATDTGASPSAAAAADADDEASAARPATPADKDVADAQNDDLKEQVSSPKKKRPHDQLDGVKGADEADARSVVSTDSAKDRAAGLEPEKKRHRDEDSSDQSSKQSTLSRPPTAARGTSPANRDHKASAGSFSAPTFGGGLAAGGSPFAALGGSSKGSVFGSAGAAPLSSFASPSAPSQSQPAAPPKLTFGGTSGASPFAGLSSGSNGFGSAFGNNSSSFGSALSGSKPFQGFGATSSTALQSDKPTKPARPAKPFGAPDSDSEDGGDENEEDGTDESPADDEERAASPEKESEERKRTRLQKIEVDDGEAGEATLASVRAKIFHHDKEAGWKERGAGMLRINVPQACAEFDESGIPIPGSFDASGLEINGEDGEGEEHKVCRLIMRQDQTHRVILNTAIVPAVKFVEKASLKSVGILFTAFEGEEAKPVSITMRMSAANAKIFMNEMSIIQRELQGN